MLAWFACSFFGRWHWLLVAALVIWAATNCLVLWLHVANSAFLQRMCRFGVVSAYCNFVGYCIGERVPMDTSRASRGSGLLLKSERDFRQAGARGKNVVRGHDDVLDTMLTRVHENLTLRKSRRDGKSSAPIGSFLLCGKEGIGKRFLARVFSKLMFRGGSVEVFQCSRITATELLKPDGILDSILNRDAFTLLLFEEIESANERLLEVLAQMVTSGKVICGNGNNLSVKNSVIVFTSCHAIDELEALRRSKVNGAAGKQKRVDIFRDSGIPASLVNGLSEILYCQAPTNHVQAEVVALVMRKECRDHGIDLCHVDPEILATQVIQIDDAHGFELVPQRAKHLLRKPLVAAADKGQKFLSLRILERSSK